MVSRWPAGCGSSTTATSPCSPSTAPRPATPSPARPWPSWRGALDEVEASSDPGPRGHRRRRTGCSWPAATSRSWRPSAPTPRRPAMADDHARGARPGRDAPGAGARGGERRRLRRRRRGRGGLRHPHRRRRRALRRSTRWRSASCRPGEASSGSPASSAAAVRSPLLTTGRVLDAAAALELGLFDEVVPRAEFDAHWRDARRADRVRAPRRARRHQGRAARRAPSTARPTSPTTRSRRSRARGSPTTTGAWSRKPTSGAAPPRDRA